MPEFEISFLSDYTDEALLEELRRVAKMLPETTTLSKSTYNSRKPRVASSTLCRRFGGWEQALMRADLGHLYSGQQVSEKMRVQSAKGMSEHELIAELRRVHLSTGKPWLTTEDFNSLSSINESAVRNRFGTFKNGLDIAGVPTHPLNTGRVSDEQCFENLAGVWTHLGRAPQYREIFAIPSVIQGKTYITRWRTWRNALIAFASWANADENTDLGRGSVTPMNDESAERVFLPQTISLVRQEVDCRDVRPGLRFKVFRRDNFRCVACGRSPALHVGVELHADHITAVAKGGRTTYENLQTLCRGCNLGKGHA